MRVSQDSPDNSGSLQPAIENLHLDYPQEKCHNMRIGFTTLPKTQRDTIHKPIQHKQHNEMGNADRIGHWGDDIKPVSDDTVRLIYQSINGLVQSSMLHAGIQKNGIRIQGHVIGMCETNVNWNNVSFRVSWERKMTTGQKTLYFSHSSCNEGYSKILRRGGCSMISTNKMESHLTQPGNDEDMGQWAWQRFKCQDRKHLTIITAYQVSQKSAQDVGMETEFMQQWRFLKTQQVDPVNPRAQFWQDLSVKIQQLQDEGDEIILMLHANSDFDDVQFLQKVHSNLTSLTPPPESYRRRKKKIDFILGLLAISQAVVRGGIMDYNNGFKYSDHRALFIDVDEGRLFSAQRTRFDCTNRTGTTLQKKLHVKKYLTLVHKHLTAHNVVERCSSLRKMALVKSSKAVKLEADKIDNEVTNAVLHAKKKVANKNYGYRRSPQLALAGCTVTFWRNFLHLHKDNFDPAVVASNHQRQEFGSDHQKLGYKFYASKLDDSWTTLCLTPDNSIELRQEFLSGLINEAILKKNKTKEEAAVKHIKEAEYMARLWPPLRKYAKGEVRSGLNKIEIPVYDSLGEIIDFFRTVSDASEMFQHLIQRHSQHFAQTENTPFVNSIFGKHLHPFQQNEFSESILEGTIDLFEINSAIAACISEMKFPVGEMGQIQSNQRLPMMSSNKALN